MDETKTTDTVHATVSAPNEDISAAPAVEPTEEAAAVEETVDTEEK